MKYQHILTKEILEISYKELQSLKAVGRKFSISADTIKDYMNFYNLDYKKQVKHTCNHDFFKEENEQSFYLAGFIAADGCVKHRVINNSNLYELVISLASIDESHLIKIKNILNTTAPITNRIINNSKRNKNWNNTSSSSLSITSKAIFNDLKKFNIVPRKSLIYSFPEWLQNHPMRNHFIRGYNDGDGSFYSFKSKKPTSQMFFSMRGTSIFLEKVRGILENDCNLEKRHKPIRISSNHGVLEYGGNIIVKKICNYLYKDATIYLDRKYEKIKHLMPNPHHSI